MTGVAGGNITPSRFVIRSTTADATFTQATTTTPTLAGISGPGTRNIPGAADDGFIAISGENFRMYQSGADMEAPLEYGGTVTAGDLLTSDSSGRGVTATTGNFYGAQAIEAGTVGQICTVKPITGTM